MCTYLNKTGATYYFRRPVPDDLLGYFRTERDNPRAEWKRSLGTKDREDAKRLLRPHVNETDNLIDDAREALQIAPPLSPEAFAALEREHEAQAAEAELECESRERRAKRSELRTLWHRRRATSTAQLSPEQAAAVDLLRERDAKIAELTAAIAVMGAGNDALGIPGPNATASNSAARAGAALPLSLTALFEDYAATGTARAHTIAKWRTAIKAFIAYAGHDDALAVTRAEVSAWLQSLVEAGLAVRTVTGTYRAALARVLSRAENVGRIPTNPAANMEVIGPKATKTKRDDISDGEAEVILTAALAPPPRGLGARHALARRWAPWICAYTGSRITEVTQMRASDIAQEGGVWVFRITPDAGSIKTDKFRLVPVHSHLIEQGILTLAKAGDDTPLFYDPAAARNPHAVQKQPQQLGSKLAGWIRGLGVLEVASPNHGWRHRFKTIARSVGIPADVRDTLQGHAARTEGETYGGWPLAIMRDAIELIPRYEIGGAER